MRSEIGDFLQTMELEGKRPRTLSTYRLRLQEFEEWVGDVPLEDVTPQMIAQFLAYLTSRQRKPGFGHKTKPQGKLSKATIRLHYMALSALFSWAVRMGYRSDHPVKAIRVKQANNKAPAPHALPSQC